MAQNLMERLKAIARDQASAESIDFALGEDDREEAAAKAGRLDRTVKALDAEIARVAALLEERRSNEARRAVEAEKLAARTERDEIAATFAKRVPAITAELIALFTKVNDNAERLKRAGVHEADAEFIARGVPANGYVQMTPVARFTAMKIPAWSGLGRAWPVDHEAAMAASIADNYSEQLRKGREDAERREREKAEAAAKFAAENGTYRLSVTGLRGDGIVHIPKELVTGQIPHALGCWDDRELVLAHTVADQLAKVPHLKVERIEKAARR